MPPLAGKRPPIAYQAGLLLVTIAMVILPALYVVLTGLAIYGVYYFATECFPAVWDWPVRGRYGLVAKFVCSFTPLLVGGAIAIAMVTPLFARRQKRMQPLALDPAVEPRVYAFVQDICQRVGAPSPRRIELDCDVNASASFDRGLGGFAGNDLILTLGLPLVAGLTAQQMGGVIAHEFGHFRQAFGMRLSYIIRSVNFWFARVIYDRDGWDEMLESAAASSDGWMSLMVGCARAGVGLSRGVLWLLMMTGHGISGFLLRQMEYDADRWEIQVAGSASFESTMMRLTSLGAVMTDIRREMLRSWRKNLQLPDNLPVLLEYRVARIPEKQREKAEFAAMEGKTGWFDTHPSATDRVTRARKIGAPGELISDEPARELFENFNSLSRLVTRAHYEDDLNVPTEPDFLIPLESLIAPPKEASAPQPPPKPAPMPMMSYDPSAFRKPVESKESQSG